MKPKKVPAKKPVKVFPALDANARPLNSVSEARQQVAAVEGFAKGGKEKFVAYTNLLSRAFAGKRNHAVVKLISTERDRLRISWPGKKPFREKAARERKLLPGNVSENTIVNLKALDARLGKGDFKNSYALIHLLVSDTPRKYAGIVAARLEAIGTQQELKFLRQNSKDPVFIETITMLYAAAGELYKLRGLLENAEEMFNAAAVFNARAKSGF